MLTKLLKYDLKSAYKLLSVFYLLSIFFAVLTRLFFSVDNSLVANIIAKICSGVTISMIFNIFINNIMRLWVTFRSSLFGDNSYLTHTLPIKKETLHLSKFLLMLITIIVSFLVIILSLFIAYYSKENMEVLKMLMLPIADSFEISTFVLVSTVIIVLILEMINIIQCGYTGLLLGHMKNNNKLGYSVVFGFIAYMITQITILFTAFVVAIFNKDIMNLFITKTEISLSAFKGIAIFAIIIYLICIIIYYYLNKYLLKKGVNVD